MMGEILWIGHPAAAATDAEERRLHRCARTRVMMEMLLHGTIQVDAHRAKIHLVVAIVPSKLVPPTTTAATLAVAFRVLETVCPRAGEFRRRRTGRRPARCASAALDKVLRHAVGPAAAASAPSTILR